MRSFKESAAIAISAMAASAGAACVDDPNFVAQNGLKCAAWAGVECQTHSAGLRAAALDEVLRNCPATCNTCIPASDYCDNGVGGDTVKTLVNSDVDLFSKFDFFEDELLTTACQWQVADPNGAEGFAQTSNAWGNPKDNSLMGCMAIVKNQNYKDFIMSVDVEAGDNDGVGLVFGYTGLASRFQVHVINDRWPDPAADSVPGPHMKFKYRNGKPVLNEMTSANVCFDTLGYVADDSLQKVAHAYPDGKLASMPYIPLPYSDRYHDYGSTFTLTLIVKDGAARAYTKAADGATVGVWIDQLPFTYFGGSVGVFTYAMNGVIFSNLRVTDISATAAPLGGECEDPSKTCDKYLGLCCTDGQCVVPTPSPTPSPTWGSAGVPDPEICPGPVGGSQFAPEMRLTSFDLVEHEMLSEPCRWVDDPQLDGIRQQSNAWGNPGDNSLMGCMALEKQEFTNFVAEMDVTSYDNDGVGFVFGYKNLEDHYVAISINDIWPQPAADGVGGPFIKIKRRNGKPCLTNMEKFNTCWDTLAWMDGTTSTQQGGPFNYDRIYPYKDGDDYDFMVMTLIVKGRNARIMFQSPSVDNAEPINNIRQGNKFTSTWTTDLPETYKGGRIGVFTYAHQATFSKLTITDLGRGVGGYCNGAPNVHCDSANSGLCVGVAVSGVCPNPVGAQMVNTGKAASFDFVDDEFLNAKCQWNAQKDGRLAQTSNANRVGNDYTLVGCNALVKGSYFEDFIAQVTIENHDNDAVGFVFGWQSLERHCKVHMINDIWPSPSADSVTGPHLKVKCRNGLSCETQPMDYTTDCYDTLAFVDAYGSYHHMMPDNAVAPAEYANRYVEYGRYNAAVMTLMVRNNQLRAVFTPGTGDKVVGVMDFDMQNHYTPGQVGLFTFADQAVFSEFSVTPLSGPGAASKFCNGEAACLPNGLCANFGAEPTTTTTAGASKKSSSDDDGDDGTGTLVGVILGLLALSALLGAAGYYYGQKYGPIDSKTRAHAILNHDMEMMDSMDNQAPAVASANPLRASAGGAIKDTNYNLLAEGA